MPSFLGALLLFICFAIGWQWIIGAIGVGLLGWIVYAILRDDNNAMISKTTRGYGTNQSMGLGKSEDLTFVVTVRRTPKNSTNTRLNYLAAEQEIRPNKAVEMAIPSQSSRHLKLAPTQGLIIEKEPLQKIVSGRKTWELRTRPTKKRHSIALIEKGGRRILGIATIIDSKGPLSHEEMLASESLHGVERSRMHAVLENGHRYAWILDEIIRLNPPIPYSPTPGAVIFANLSEEECKAIQAALENNTMR